MTLEQLRIFVAVAEREHVTRAAEALSLTQSAVSGAIAALEAQHGVRLFDRVGRGVALNAAGREFLGEARAVLGRAAAASALLDDLGGLRRGSLSLAAAPTIASYWLPSRLARFRRAYPGVTLEVATGDTAAVTRMVLEGEAELGFVGAREPHPLLTARAVGRDQPVVAAAPDHPWARRTRLDAEDIEAADWIMREPGAGARTNLEEGLRAAGVAPAALRVGLVLPSDEAVLAVTETGLGVAALPEAMVAPALAAGRLARAALPLPARDYFLIRHRERHHGQAANAFADMLRTA